MGLRLKAQVLTLFLVLYSLAFAVLAYFNLALVNQDNQARTFHEAEREAHQLLRRCLAQTPDLSAATVTLLASRHASVLMTQVEKNPNLQFVELFAANGQKLFGFGRRDGHFPLAPEAQQWVHEHRESFQKMWEYADDSDTVGVPFDGVGLFSTAQVALEVYHPLLDEDRKVVGVLHLSVNAPRGQVRLNLVVLGNLMLGAIFLVSSLLAFNLWGEYALNRPLRGLVEAERRLKRIDNKPPDPEDALSSNELVTISRSFNRMALDLVKYQRELEQSNDSYRMLNEQLENKVEEKTAEMKEFFSLVSHDLRIPLAAVAGYADLLGRKRSAQPLTEKQEKFVRSIVVANSHAQDLVRNLLDAMRYEFGSPQVVEQEFDLGELLEDIVSHLAVEGSNLHVELPPESPCLVYADRTRIGRVLTNLVGNAVRCCESDTRVQVTVREVGEELQVEVRDWGPGIDPEVLPRLFEKFKQQSVTDSTSSGLGLGLYIVKRILQDHGRDIAVESVVGEGTRFTFTLPRSKENR